LTTVVTHYLSCWHIWPLELCCPASPSCFSRTRYSRAKHTHFASYHI